MRTLIGLATERRWLGVLGLGMNGLLQSLSLLYFVVQVRNDVMNKTALGWGEVGMIVGLGVFLSLTRFVERAGAEQLALRYVHAVRNQIFGHFLQLPTPSAVKVSRGGLLLRLTGDLSALRNWIVQGMIPLLMLSIWFSVAIVALLMVDPVLVVVLAALILLSLPVYWIGGRRLYEAASDARNRRARLVSYTSERISGIALIQSMNQTGREKKRFGRHGRELLVSLKRRAYWVGILRGLTEFTSLALIGVLAIVGNYRVEQGVLPLDQFVMILVVALYLLPQLRRLGRVYEYWTQYRLAHSKLEYFVRRKTLRQSGKRLDLNTGEPVAVGLSMDDGSTVFHAASGARIGVSGSRDTDGVSALQTLVGLESADGFDFTLEGVAVQELSASERQRRIVLVSERFPLWHASISTNLRYGMRHTSPQEFEQIVELCGLPALIEHLPGQMRCKLGPRGTVLSSSDSFAVMLARALLRKPSLLAIDHPAATLDPASQRLVARVARNFAGTLIVTLPHAVAVPDWITDRWNLPDTAIVRQEEDEDLDNEVVEWES